jgi:hypothetical protein
MLSLGQLEISDQSITINMLSLSFATANVCQVMTQVDDQELGSIARVAAVDD